MSGEASMKIDTKVTSFIMLVIIIGLVVVMPIFVVSAEETNNAYRAPNPTAAQKGNWLQNSLDNILRKNAEHAVTKSPLGSSATITYAYVDLNQAGRNDTASWTGAKIHVMANITLTSEVNLEYADAKVEFYGINICSEQGSIVNLTYNLIVDKPSPYGSGSGYIAV